MDNTGFLWLRGGRKIHHRILHLVHYDLEIGKGMACLNVTLKLFKMKNLNV